MEGYVTIMLKRSNKIANKIIYISMAAVILIAGGLLAFSLFGEAVWGQQDSEFLPLVRTETIYIIIVLAILLPP